MRRLPFFLIFYGCIVCAQYNDCGLDEKSLKLAKLIIENSNQRRVTLKCNKLLAVAAQDKAKLMAKANKVSHIINHVTPNEFLTSYHVNLPNDYNILGNQVEAIQGGMETSHEAFDFFMTSHSHKEHILGEKSFYRQQNQIGVGYFHDEQSRYEDYWVVYVTKVVNESEVANLNSKYRVKLILKKEKQEKRKRFQKSSNLSR